MSESKVAAEVAEAEFERFVEAMDLDVDPAGMDDDDKRSFESARRRLLKAMMAGQLVVNEQGEPVYSPGFGDPITFHEPTGATYMAMDQKREGHNFGKTVATLAEMTRLPATRFSKMANRDFKVCSAILGLFLGG